MGDVVGPDHLDQPVYLWLPVEYLSKKDFTENWASEIHEEFAFWGFEKWTTTLRQVGFVVNPAAYVYTNPWIVDNRRKGGAFPPP